VAQGAGPKLLVPLQIPGGWEGREDGVAHPNSASPKDSRAECSLHVPPSSLVLERGKFGPQTAPYGTHFTRVCSDGTRGNGSKLKRADLDQILGRNSSL